jgi:dihydrofolate reductase
MKTIIIAAMTKDMVIGKDNKLLWHLPEDLKNFKKLTNGNTVIMGRKTFESIKGYLGKPLPNRNNIILTRSMQPEQGVTVATSIEESLEKAKMFGKDAFIIGGSSIYRQFLSLADYMYLSFVKKDYKGDAYFPEFSLSDWKEEKREDKGDFEFVIFKRKEK